MADDDYPWLVWSEEQSTVVKESSKCTEEEIKAWR